jgi:ribosomal protein S18 acetylase RimI-like enzyme
VDDTPETRMAAAFRATTAADVDAILAHQRTWYAEEGWTFDLAVARVAMLGLLADAARGRLWTLDDDGVVAGHLSVTFGWSLEYQGRDAFMDELWIAPSHRGRGFGREGLALAERTCLAAGVRALHLEVERTNARARGLYRRSGYAETARLLLTKRLTPTR